MALLDFDSFDYYQTAELPEVYTNVYTGASSTLNPGIQIEVGTGRCNSNCLVIDTNPGCTGVIRGITTSSNVVMFGCAIKATAISSVQLPILDLISEGIPTFSLRLAVDGSFQGYFNPDAAFPPLSFSSVGGLIPFDTWTYLGFYIEMVGTPGNPGTGTGVVKIEIDGVLRQTLTGLQTCWSTDNPVPASFRIGGAGFESFVRYDDMYFQDDSGPAPWNDLLGDVHVQRLRPIGAGALTEFTVTNAAENWIAEDKGDTPDTSSYISSDTVNITDTYQYEDMANVPGTVIYGVKESAQAQKDTAGVRTIEFLKRKSGVNYPTGEDLGLPIGDYAYVRSIMANDPQTGSQWASVNAINGSAGNEFGVKVSS